jgi:hypothetical protein
MGIDWFRMRPKPDADAGELDRLIALQAEAFQKLPIMWATDSIEQYDLYDEATVRRLQEQSGDACEALEQLLDFPPTGPDGESPADDPDLWFCWRVYPITQFEFFPLRWRLEAHRTILPHELGRQLAVWREWIAAVDRGEHRRYLLDLCLYETVLDLHLRYPDLRKVAERSLSKAARWANKPEIAEIRERIFAFELPALYPAPLFPPPDPQPLADPADDPAYRAITGKVDELVALTRAWDYNAKQNYKLRYYENCYRTFQQFLDRTKDKWLHEFFAWADECCSRGMGLYLDY